MLSRALILILGLLAGGAQAFNYTEAELDRVRNRTVPDVRAVFRESIVARLPRDIRARGAAVRLSFPETGRTPLDFYADPVAGVIYMPLTSMRFFDDVATLFAWAEAKGCAPDAVQAYLWRLLRQGEDLPPPLVAFGIDREAAHADPFAGDVSGKTYSSGLQFILAHELGHVLLNHRGGLQGAASQRQELAADAFAYDHFARLGGLPVGVFWYFMAAAWIDPVGDAARAGHTHPVSPERVRRLGERLSERPGDFTHGELDRAKETEFAATLGRQITGMAEIIAGDWMLTDMPMLLAEDWPAGRFVEACP